MSDIITVDESVDKIMTEAAGACYRAAKRANRTYDLVERGRVSRNSYDYYKALAAIDEGVARCKGLVDMWAALTGATDAEREAFWNRYMFPAKEAARNASEPR